MPGSTTIESQHFRYHFRPGDAAVCEDVLIEIERHFAALQSYLHFAWPAGRQIDYWKFLDQSDFDTAQPCRTPHVAGCAPGGAVFSLSAVDRHELVHAYLAPTGLPPPVLLEGMAEGISCIGTGAADDTDRAAIAAMAPADLVAWSADRAHYYAGVRLVRLLIDSFGVASAMAAYAQLDYQSTESEIDARFIELFGAGLADLWAAARDKAYPGGYCLTPFACTGPPAGDPVPVALGSCGSHETFQEIAAAPGSTTVLDVTGQGEILVGACDGLQAAPGLSAGTSTASHRTWIVQLAAGDYFVRHRPTGPGDRLVGTATSATPPLVTAGCTPGSSPVPAPSSTTSDFLTVIVPDSGDDWSLPLRATPGGEVHVSEILPPPAESAAQLCPGCSSPAGCQTLTAASVATTLTGDYVLSIPTAGASGTFRYVLIDHP